jgi:HD superfamily phosphohydrolase
MPKGRTGSKPPQLSLPRLAPNKMSAAMQGAPNAPRRHSPTATESYTTVDNDPFSDEFEFLDDVHGYVRLNRLERDVIDTPEFQRLFRLGQLGFVDLVFPTANHTRGVHSIGACHWAKALVDRLNENNTRQIFTSVVSATKVPQISPPERVLISLGALLHDISHGPYSHDIEKKTHYLYLSSSQSPLKIKSHYGPYEKHYSFLSNPALYVFIHDQTTSVLARLLRHYSPSFSDRLVAEATTSDQFPHLTGFVTQIEKNWPDYRDELLPSLLFHLLVYEKPIEAEDSTLSLSTSFASATPSSWGLGPQENRETLHRAWYQPFRHDIVGDTLSADLIDYLLRDQARLGMKNELDLKILDYYILVDAGSRAHVESHRTYRCAIDLSDHKRGTFRADRLNDIFRLLDLRHQIHEKAVHHRVVQSAIAMLSRTILVLGKDLQPPLEKLYGLAGTDTTASLASDDRFLESLIAAFQQLPSGHADRHRSLPCKLAERRVYRPLMVIPGDRVPILLSGQCDLGSGLEHSLRELAAVVDSPFFSSFFLLISLLIERFLQVHCSRELRRTSADRRRRMGRSHITSRRRIKAT